MQTSRNNDWRKNLRQLTELKWRDFATVAADFGVGVPTVSDWVKMKNTFEEHASKTPKKKTMKTCQTERLKAVF